MSAIERFCCFALLAPLFHTGPSSADPTMLVQNDQVVQTFQQNNLGGQVPQLVQQDDGGTRIEWHGGVAVDAYHNDIDSVDGSMLTPLQSGSFYKSVVQSDLRGITPAGATNYFQFGVTSTDDPAVLKYLPRQLNNLQVGRAAQDYQFGVGDIAPNFSSLSSALGARGAIGQQQFGNSIVYGYGGVVAESWEALDNTAPRNQLLRDVYGVKLEHALAPEFKLYATSQGGADREDSVNNPNLVGMVFPPSTIHSASVGFQYQRDQFQLTGESAQSKFKRTGYDELVGHAAVLDANWRGQTLGLRAGYHELDPEYASLSTMVQPGIVEGYTGADWMAASWLNLGVDLRNSKKTTLATLYSPLNVAETDAGSLRAGINFGPDLPGWALNLQQSESKTRDLLMGHSSNNQSTVMVNYASPVWNGGLGYGIARVRNDAWPTTDSDTHSWQASLGRMFGNVDGSQPDAWIFNTNIATQLQEQHFLTTDSYSRNVGSTFTLSGQKAGWGSVNLVLMDAMITQPTASPRLKTHGWQMDLTRQISTQGAVKVYVRDTHRNIADPLLNVREQVGGMQLSYNF